MWTWTREGVCSPACLGRGGRQPIVCSSSSSSATITTTPLSLSLSHTHTHTHTLHTCRRMGVHAVTPAARLRSVEARLAALCLCQEPCLEAGGVLLGSGICLANRKPQRHQQHAPRRHGEDCSLSTYRCRVDFYQYCGSNTDPRWEDIVSMLRFRLFEPKA